MIWTSEEYSIFVWSIWKLNLKPVRKTMVLVNPRTYNHWLMNFSTLSLLFFNGTKKRGGGLKPPQPTHARVTISHILNYMYILHVHCCTRWFFPNSTLCLMQPNYAARQRIRSDRVQVEIIEKGQFSVVLNLHFFMKSRNWFFRIVVL